jgi:integrase
LQQIRIFCRPTFTRVEHFLIEEKIEETMLLPIKPICEAKNIRKDGTSVIFIQYCYSSEKRVTLNTEIAIPPKYWVKKKLSISPTLPIEFGSHEQLNDSLKQMLRLAEDLIELATKQGIAEKGVFVKQAFKPNLDIQTLQTDAVVVQQLSIQRPKSSNDFYGQFEDYIRSKEKKVSKATKTVFKNTMEHIQAFDTFRGKKVTFNSFDYAYYTDLVDFLTYDYVLPRKKETTCGLKNNTIGKTIRQLRIFLRDRIRRKIIATIDLSDFKILEEETDAIYLTYAEIEKIYNTELSEYPFLKEYRDLFVLACLTGLRFSDFSTLRPEDLRNNMLYKKQEKSDHWVVIPLRKVAKDIFTSQFRERIPQLTNPEFNRHIKTIGKLAGITGLITFSCKKGNKDVIQTRPKFDWITTHTARRSFCTNEFLAGTPVPLIMKISGHKKEKDFYRYIRVQPEEAALKIQALWDDREKVESFPVIKIA